MEYQWDDNSKRSENVAENDVFQLISLVIAHPEYVLQFHGNRLSGYRVSRYSTVKVLSR